MVETTRTWQESGGSSTGSATGEALGQVQDKARDVAGQAKEKAQEASGQATGRVRQEIDSRSSQAAEQVDSTAQDLRSVAEELRNQGNETPAKLADAVAQKAEQVGGYLKDSDAERILGDVEDFARRQPWAVMAGGIALGLVASRFLKASSRDRYRERELSAGGYTSTRSRSDLRAGIGTYGVTSAGVSEGPLSTSERYYDDDPLTYEPTTGADPYAEGTGVDVYEPAVGTEPYDRPTGADPLEGDRGPRS